MSSKRCNIDTSRRNAAPPWWPLAWGGRLSASVSRIGSKRRGFLLLTCSHGCAGPGPTSCCDCSKRFPEGHSSARSWTATSHDMEGCTRRHRASRSGDCLNDGRPSFRPITMRQRTGRKAETIRVWVRLAAQSTRSPATESLLCARTKSHTSATAPFRCQEAPCQVRYRPLRREPLIARVRARKNRARPAFWPHSSGGTVRR